MQLPTIIEQSGQRVLTTAQLAEAYGTDTATIKQNFKRNKERYEENRHFYLLTGENLKKFAGDNSSLTISNMTRSLYLWTERGALFHAKSLNTDKAWEVFGFLVENYFRAKKETKPAEPDYSKLSPQLQFMIQMEQRQNALEARQNELDVRQNDLSARVQVTENLIDKGLQNAYASGYRAAKPVSFERQKLFTELVKVKAKILCKNLPGGYEKHGMSIIRSLYGRVRKEFHVVSYTELNLQQFDEAWNLVQDMTFERLMLKLK